MARVGISKEYFDNVGDYQPPGGNFRLPSPGVGVKFVAYGRDESKTGQGSFKLKDGSGEHAWLSIPCTFEYEDGDEVGLADHGEFFDMDDENGVAKFKAFVTALGLGARLGEDFDTEELAGIEFLCDVSHYEKKNTGKMAADLNIKTITLVGGGEAPKAEAPAKAAPAPKQPPRTGRGVR